MAINVKNSTTTQNPYDYDSMAILGVHDEYLEHSQRWKFLINSYMGGHEYRMGKYLTQYVYESGSEYMQRVLSTPLDNHVRSVVHTYNSFLFRQEPYRDYGNLRTNQELPSFLKDCDLEGRTWQSFMRDVNVMSTVYGHCLVLLDRPQSQAGTRADELAQGIRTYANLFTPENILDWKFTRLPSGHYELTYLKLLEIEDKSSYGNTQEYYVRIFTQDKIVLQKYNPRKDSKDAVQIVDEQPNELGKIPAVFVYANRSPERGIGVSDIGDIADTQNLITNQTSEIEQIIRLSNAPSLVKTQDTDAAAGAGAIITIPNELDAGLKPYLLQPSSQSIDGIIRSIEKNIQSIDRMAHMGAIRAIETRQMSGVAMQSEFLLLDAKLCEKGKNLQLAEEQIWRIWALWQGESFDGDIMYPMAFHIRDKNLDMDLLKKASDSKPTNPKVKALIDKKIAELLATEEELEEIFAEASQEEMEHPTTSVDTQDQHIQEMVMEGYEDEQMLELHPELTQADIQTAKQKLIDQ